MRPEAVRVLEEIGIDITHYRSKGLGDIDLDSVEVVVTLYAEEVCPAFPRPVVKVHWGLPDPAAVEAAITEGSEITRKRPRQVAADDVEARLAAFREVRDELRRRLSKLFAPAW